MSLPKDSKFRNDVHRGRRFEAEEKAIWNHIPSKQIRFEAPTIWSSKHGRIDIKINENDGSVSVIEIKATDWDAILHHRIRITAQRHARQLWRYINAHAFNSNIDICAGVIYENKPNNSDIRIIVEQILNDNGCQVVWRKP